MIPHLFFYQLVLIALVWVFLMLYGLWPWEPAAVRPPPPKPVTPPRKRSCAPQPFIGPTRKPPCDACEEGVAPRCEPRWALAAVALHRLRWLLFGDPWHPVPRQARLG